MRICCSYKCAVTQHQFSAALVWAKCIPHCSKLLCKRSSKHACGTAAAPMRICCSYKCAVTQHQFSAALVWAKCIPHCSKLLCKRSSKHACGTAAAPMRICCSFNCSDPTPMLCSTSQGKMHSPLAHAQIMTKTAKGCCLCIHSGTCPHNITWAIGNKTGFSCQ